jgi:hypothetical protein
MIHRHPKFRETNGFLPHQDLNLQVFPVACRFTMVLAMVVMDDGDGGDVAVDGGCRC